MNFDHQELGSLHLLKDLHKGTHIAFSTCPDSGSQIRWQQTGKLTWQFQTPQQALLQM